VTPLAVVIIPASCSASEAVRCGQERDLSQVSMSSKPLLKRLISKIRAPTTESNCSSI